MSTGKAGGLGMAGGFETIGAEVSLAPTPAPSPRWLPLAVLAVLVMWASAFIGIRAVAPSFAPGPLALGRLLVGAAVLTAIAVTRGIVWPRGRALALVLGYGVLWFAGYTVALNAAEHHLDAGTAAMLVNIAPLLVAVAAGAVLGEGFPRSLLVGIAVSLAGVALIAGAQASGSSDAVGVVLGLLAAVLYAVGVLTQKVALRTVDVVTATWLGCVAGVVVLLPFLGQLLDQVQRAPATAVASMVYLGVSPTAIAVLLWAAVLRRSTAGGTASATLAVPAIAVLLSWWLLGEVPAPVAAVGGALALLGVAISHRRPRAEAASRT